MSGFYNRKQNGTPIAIYDEGVLLTNNVSSIDFVGTTVSGSVIGSAVTETFTGGSSGTSVVAEVVSGTINDVNVTFTLAHTPTDTPKIFLNGVRQLDPDHYSISGTTITFVNAPLTGSKVTADYTY